MEREVDSIAFSFTITLRRYEDRKGDEGRRAMIRV